MDRSPRTDGLAFETKLNDRDESPNPFSGVVLEGELVFDSPPRPPWIGVATLIYFSLTILPFVVGVFLAPFTLMASLPVGLIFSLIAAIALLPFYLLFVLAVLAWRLLFGGRSRQEYDTAAPWRTQEFGTRDESPPAPRRFGPSP